MRDLFDRARRVSERALELGALGPIRTRVERVEDGGIPFVLRVVSSLADKRRAQSSRAPTDDPFLPYEEALFVVDAGPDHVVLLNKFPALEEHVLLCTRHYEDQAALLTLADFEALHRVAHGAHALLFYNAGRVAGASQRHKHLQLVPLPLAEGPGDTPIDAAVEAGALPYPHSVVERPGTAAADHAAYLELLSAIDATARPYNLLATSRWMLAVPRRAEAFEGISVNALGFVGSLFARDDEELARLRAAGPVRILRSVAGRRA